MKNNPCICPQCFYHRTRYLPSFFEFKSEKDLQSFLIWSRGISKENQNKLNEWLEDLNKRYLMAKNKKVGHDEYFENYENGLRGFIKFLKKII